MPQEGIDVQQAEAILRRYWGHARFRPGQWEVIEAVLQGRDVLAILPTGAGKSICYQVPGLLQEGFTLVVSPLIALMQDQVTALNAHGISAAFINSTLSQQAIDQRWTDVEYGRYQFLYVAPERLQTELFVARAERLNVALLAIDEAHCVSEWGHHFRPDYLKIPEARARLGDPPTLAVTATATPEVRRDVAEQLALRDPKVIVKGFDRPSIVWSVFHVENKRAKVQEVIDGVPGSGLLYAATRRSVEGWAAWLQQQEVPAAAYHAGLRPADREAVQKDWLQGKTRIVAATNAFGMGIDKPDVRFVIHADAPGSLEAYYQEAGRAGRDRERAYAVLLYRSGDDATQRALIEHSHPDAQAVRQVYDAVCNLAQIPIGTLPDEPIAFDYDTVLHLTGHTLPLVRAAGELLERQETWQLRHVRRHHALVRFNQPAGALRRYIDGLQNQRLARFVQEILRTIHADAFSTWWEIDLHLLERRTGLDRTRLLRGLDFMKERGLLDWRGPSTAAQVWLNEPRTQQLPVDDRAVLRARRRAEVRLRDMLRYAQAATCRRHFLLTYFGEAHPPRCGACDICLGRHRAEVITPQDEPVLRHIVRQVGEAVPRAAWFEEPPVPEQRLNSLVDWLVQEGYLAVEAPLAEQYALTEKAHDLMRRWDAA